MQARAEPASLPVTCFAADNDSQSVATYRANFGDHVICDDIKNITDFPKADVVISGPPCRGFSRLGRQAKLERPENELWRDYFRRDEVSNPLAFVIENVPELLKDAAFEGITSKFTRSKV